MFRKPKPTSKFLLFLRNRPWIWVVLGYCVFVVAIVTIVVIAIKNAEPSVPLNYGR